MYRIVILM